jgi:hypothetical protein
VKVRTAISRAYFYVLLEIRTDLEKFGVKFMKGIESHKEVENILSKAGEEKEVEIVISKLRDFKKKRNDADYELDMDCFEYPTDEAKLAIMEAERVIENYSSINKSILIKLKK